MVVTYVWVLEPIVSGFRLPLTSHVSLSSSSYLPVVTFSDL